jgi:hypothetical protein
MTAHYQTQRGKWIGEVFWHKGVLEAIDKHETTSPSGRFINPNQKFQSVIWF